MTTRKLHCPNRCKWCGSLSPISRTCEPCQPLDHLPESRALRIAQDGRDGLKLLREYRDGILMNIRNAVYN